MKFIIISSVSLLILFSVMLYDNFSYNEQNKYSNIKQLASQIKYSTVSLQFKSYSYKEFVYAK